MSTSISPGSPTARLWAVVSIEAAWTLQVCGVRCTPALLHEVRRHILLTLPKNASEDRADACTAPLVREFLKRFRGGDYSGDPPADPRPLQTIWRDAILEGLDPIGMVVWRLMYGDGLDAEAVEARCKVDRVVLSSAREGMRCALRSLIEDGDGQLDDDELDRLLARLARMPTPDCTGGAEALSASKEHIERCPRCCRAVRLGRAGLLKTSDLVAPAKGWNVERISVLALNLHPDGRHHRDALLDTFGAAAIPVADDTVVVDLDRTSNHVSMLYALAEEGTPSKHHMRGALVRGPGRWHDRGLIGPVARASIGESRSRQWGEIDTVGTLPEILPPPPSATPWWGAAVLVTLAAAFAGVSALERPADPPTYPIEAIVFQQLADTVIGRFDVDDAAYTLVVLDGPEGLTVLHADDLPADKGEIATGVGDYAVTVAGRRLLVASSPEPFVQVEELVTLVRATAQPLDELASRLDALHDKRADLVIQPLPDHL